MGMFKSFKAVVRRNAPEGLVVFLRRVSRRFGRIGFFVSLFRDHATDAMRYFRWAHTGRADRHQRQRESAIIKSYHGFEKGLSLQMPRPGFGQDKARILMHKLNDWARQYPETNMTVAARNALKNYAAFNHQNGVELPWLETWLSRLPKSEPVGYGGTMPITRTEIEAAVGSTKEAFFFARHSIRNFGPGEVPMSDIEDAVRIAQKSPSVCNRQGVRVYCCPNAMDALQWQPGNRGFGHLASRGLVVVADLQAFCSEGERHQAFVDGGLFAMSLVYGLHAKGHGTCMLAWSERPRAEAGLRKALKIKANEVIIMMIAVGRLPETLEIACSQRRPLSDVLHIR